MRRIRKTFRLLFVLAALLLSSALPPSPASASPVAGAAVVQGNAVLPTFPCPTSPTPCTGGTFSGTWAGHMAGLDGTAAFDMTWGPAPVSASFSYAELACLAGTETLIGTASGTGTATALASSGQITGQWKSTAVEHPRPITQIRFNFTFDWVRVGNAAAVVVKPGSTFQIAVVGGVLHNVSTSEQEGTAVFAPLSVGSTTVPLCSTPLTNVSGVIAGSLTLR